LDHTKVTIPVSRIDLGSVGSAGEWHQREIEVEPLLHQKEYFQEKSDRILEKVTFFFIKFLVNDHIVQ
jgi:hypothetical protein